MTDLIPHLLRGGGEGAVKGDGRGVCWYVCVCCRERAEVGSGQQLLTRVCSRGDQHIIGRCTCSNYSEAISFFVER